MLRPPGVALSTAACSVAALGNGVHDGDMAGGAKLSGSTTTTLAGENVPGEGGDRRSSSQRIERRGW